MIRVRPTSPVVLNLAGTLLSEGILAYFSDRGIRIVELSELENGPEVTHLLTKGMQEFHNLNSVHHTVKKDIKVISLSHVEDVRDFIAANGKLVFDEVWLEGPLGAFVLDKFFQEYAGITLGDNYPTFQEKGAFSVINPFNTGEYLDRMVHQAFDQGVHALSVKTFFDHILMYVTGLKNKGKVGVPIEITYGTYEDTFAVQLHFFAQSLLLEDVTSCLNSHPTRIAEERLLNVAVQSVDFFDFTFLSEVNKVVATGLWTKSERINVENRGLMFANLSSAASITSYPSEGTTFGLMNSGEISDLSDMIHLPEETEAEGDPVISGEKFSEQLAIKISSSVELEKVKQIVSGKITEEEIFELVAGETEEDQNKITVDSHREMDEIVNLVKSSIEDEKHVFIVPGEKFKPDDFVVHITSDIKAKTKDNDWKVKSLGEKLPESIKSGLFDFAKKINKQITDLSSEDLDQFKEKEVPEIIKTRTRVVNKATMSVIKDLRSKLEDGLKQEFMEDSVEKIMESIHTPEDGARVRSLLKETLKHALDENFQLSEKNSISKEDQDLLVKSLSVSLVEDEQKIREIVNEEHAKSSEESTLFKKEPTRAEKELLSKLQNSSEENKLLKSKMRTLMSEVKALQNAKAKMTELQAKAHAEAEALASEFEDKDEKLRKEMQLKAQEGILTSEEQRKLSELLERESKLIAAARSEEIRARKFQIETEKKDTMFMQELEKFQRMLKAKDLVLFKTKESAQALLEKKDRVVLDLQNKLQQLNLALTNSPSKGQAIAIRDLEKQNAGLNKMLEMYKAKVQSLASHIQSKSDDASTKDELRKVQMINQQFKNQVVTAKKEISKLQDKSSNDYNTIIGLRKEKNLLEQQLKKALQEAVAPKEKVSTNNPLEQELKRAQAQMQTMESQLQNSEQLLKETEAKLSDALRAQKATGPSDDANKTKIAHLEANVNKLSKDLVDAKKQMTDMKKETNKLRQEKTALQNQLEKAKKESAKLMTSLRKPGSKKAA